MLNIFRFLLLSFLGTGVSSIRIGLITSHHLEHSVRTAVNIIVPRINEQIVKTRGACFITHTSFIALKNSHEDLNTKICDLANSEVSVIIGVVDRESGSIIEEQCAELNILFIHYYWTPGYQKKQQTSLNLYPSMEYSQLMERLINLWRWDNFVYIYSNYDAPKQLIETLSRLEKSPALLRAHTLDDSMMATALALRDTCDRNRCWPKKNRVLIELSPNETLTFFDASLKLGMISVHNWFLITALDDLNDHLSQYTHNGMRVSLLTVSKEKWNQNDLAIKLPDMYQEYLAKIPSNPRTPFKDFAFIFDSILLACQAGDRRIISCGDNEAVKKFKLPIVKPFKGLTGKISFNGTSDRSDSELHIWEMGITGAGLHTGIWKSTWEGSKELTMLAKNIPGTHEHYQASVRESRTLKVTSIHEKPYVIEKIMPDGRIKHEGFCVDLLDKLAEMLHFNYTLKIVKDNKYGERKNGTDEWDGMIGEILRGDADMAVAPITVTATRLEVIDFTDPFLQLGISMLMRQPNPKSSSSLTRFLWPLSASVWTFSAIATVITALLVTVAAVLSPKESTAEFKIQNSVWYLVCILLRAGSGYNCQAGATRLISAVWWSFTLVLIAQYTANFAALLTVDRKSMPFNSFEELGNQTEYNFGSILGGSTMQFFKYSRIETFRRLWERMQSAEPSAFVGTNHEGVNRVLNEKYVFLMESATLDYQVTQNCNLTRVGNVVLGSNGYSIALPKGSKWREKLTRQILDLNEKGIILMLKNNWWKKSQQECQSSEPEDLQTALGAENVYGLFLLLALGSGIGVLCAVLEHTHFIFFEKNKRNGQTPKLQQMIETIHAEIRNSPKF
ncbi:Glutamate receptor ionotropic, kainate 2 [Caenorhabditis elegans]|uniref:Glutamate receptor ionotropic, kainate 2 n=2 Tax=Caenorhabditis elegans TaxID=6239 RepID=Q8MXV8_CAEEL|nr:Glutamate receptor ionotropic, kainate 2 [Caenorhabditis elegans]CCD67907.1 Glutamate receptor ionotropic, kainate 2 [Caenorhabditis elegans]|eukprot:NP_741822.2 GLutamate Receptor family (AMPA) [Caenorhabditis elegans]